MNDASSGIIGYDRGRSDRLGFMAQIHFVGFFVRHIRDLAGLPDGVLRYRDARDGGYQSGNGYLGAAQMTTYGYTRVSDISQVDGCSLADQERVIRGCAMMRGDEDVVIFSD